MRILHVVKQTIHRLRYMGKCKFIGKAELDSKVIFEGHNWIGDGVTLLSSKLGYASYISDHTFITNTVIGKYTCIAPEVRTVAGNHPTQFASVHPWFYSSTHAHSYVSQDKFENFNYLDKTKKIAVEIGNDVWIGSRATILENIKIGDGAIIAAGAVVTKDVPPYAIVGGVPAKLIRYRFDEDQIEKLLNVKWWDRGEKWIRDSAECFDDVECFLDKFGSG